MSKPKLSVQNVLGVMAILGLFGGIFAAFGVVVETPAEQFETHVEDFDHHVDDFATYLDLEQAKQQGRDSRTKMMEAQTRVMCYETDQGTLALAGLMATCDSLGVRR